MQDDLGTRLRRGLVGAVLGSALGAILIALFKAAGNDDLELPVAIALIVASLAYWAWTKMDEA